MEQGTRNLLHLQLNLARAVSSIGLTRRVVESVLRAFRVGDTVCEDILVALSEACTNVVAYAAGVTSYTVTVALADRQCDVTVADDGPGFAAPIPSRPPTTGTPGGRGLFVIAALTDELHIDSNANGGTVLRFVKVING